MPGSEAPVILRVEQVSKTYLRGEESIEAVRGVSVTIKAGEVVAVVGPSGCGKSTLLHLCGAMDLPTSGRILIDDIDIAGLTDDALTELRRRRVGFVFQFFNLLPTLTVAENISLPLLLAGSSSARATTRAQELADRVGLSHRSRHLPRQLSGGEAQRVAIARAIIHRPVLVIADEPTGNLDSVTGGQVLALLTDLTRDQHSALLLATHAPEVARQADRILHLRDGEIEHEEVRERASA